MRHAVDIGLRLLAGLPGGYALAWGLTTLAAARLPLARTDAAGFATIAAVPVMVAAILWAFAARSPLRAVAGIGIPALMALPVVRILPCQNPAMKGSFTRSMAWVHTWFGLTLGWMLFAVLFTGTIVLFKSEIDGWMQPELPHGVVSTGRAVAVGTGYLSRIAPGADRWTLELPDRSLVIHWSRGDRSGSAILDAASNRRIAPRETEGAQFLVDVHYSLHSGVLGFWLVSLTGLLMLVAIVSGVVIHKRILRDFFIFRPAKGQRSWLDGHNVASVTTLPFQLMIAFTGLMISPEQLMPAGVKAVYGNDLAAYAEDRYHSFSRPRADIPAAPMDLSHLVTKAERQFNGRANVIAVEAPGDTQAVVTIWRDPYDRLTMLADWVAFDGVSGAVLDSQIGYGAAMKTAGVLTGLHFGQFGGYFLRWLYFAAGLASCFMVASGLILFGVKRAAKHGGSSSAAMRAVEILNVAMVMGPLLACGAYLWTNRLFPAGLADRADREVLIFFAAWLAALLHAGVRPARKAWTEQLGVAGFLCLSLPLPGLMTIGECFLTYAGRGDWSRAGVELAACSMGLALLVIARTMARDRNRQTRRRRIIYAPKSATVP